nr:cobalt ECF transporter T component CbiQ [Corynebacterium lactis]
MNALEVAASRSKWARRNVGEKTLLLGGLLVLAVSLPPIPFAPIIGVLAVAIAVVARVPLKLYAAMVLAPATFVLVGALPLLVALDSSGFSLSPTGPMRMLEVVLRSAAGISCTMAFALTTPLSELLSWLSKRGIPRSVTYLAELIYRMTGVLIDSARAMADAQARRLGHLNRRSMMRDTGGQAAGLFVIAFSRARRMQQGIELRAEPGSMRVLVISRPLDPRFVSVSLAILVALLGAWAVMKWGM